MVEVRRKPAEEEANIWEHNSQLRDEGSGFS